MSTSFSRELLPALKDKLDTRAKRIGIPESAYYLEVRDNGSGAVLFIHEEKSTGEVLDTEILRVDAGTPDGCTLSVRSPASAAAGSPTGCSGAETGPDGWDRFTFTDLSPDTVKQIPLYAADILQYEFEVYETDAEPFECCSRNYTCSIRGECLHPDQMYAKACIFRKTLPGGSR
jgi:hypothetical protein